MHKTACLLLLALLLPPEAALALDMEYYTYGGFNPIVQAFTRWPSSSAMRATRG